MLGVVGDLGTKRIIAWEISSELDLGALEREINYYIPTFQVKPLDLGFACPTGSENKSYLYEDAGYLYVDLYQRSYVRFVSRDEFFRKFQRAF